jgi:hypothetical protein
MVIHKTVPERHAQSKVSKESRLRRRDGTHHFEHERHHRDAFNKGTTPAGDAVTGTGHNHVQLSPRSTPDQSSGRHRKDVEKRKKKSLTRPQSKPHYELAPTRLIRKVNANGLAMLG